MVAHPAPPPARRKVGHWELDAANNPSVAPLGKINSEEDDGGAHQQVHGHWFVQQPQSQKGGYHRYKVVFLLNRPGYLLVPARKFSFVG